ncbi:hypothetical protein K60_004250 [Mycobacterium tuberculosis variant bovis BCG str. Korea 1168P]|uniref:Uncharacterized protein n=1 Tax=Mycobacterium tuberculosis (strain CDC 1551 / Oshkosh) TaxID=83331 RepID=Q8VKL6_MYCTO|nr:hypothetical protein MT0416 [Mycobacterium tuberculosis CDC1551]AGE66335.1 hypothetical protein K60_004250 [Mycobacterium tuberculosis variant bovis BCG str. Korea 1168P]AGL98851.1 hypothetical protein CFBS_0419 [Mycobacterium tuberculosis CCDC5079]AHJ41066.1 hypothetical protein HKBS1_0420 [Mycobacterium tuberculosis HKBS1]AHJ45216.1 hypothetical protein HKBT2_0419 [Mycobacterium tuberculosis BT2]AHJ49365.1 hypothetical protein HKBT1_0419 [Mycobacterium tuberculosis BT1]AHJ53503.1 hypothe
MGVAIPYPVTILATRPPSCLGIEFPVGPLMFPLLRFN